MSDSPSEPSFEATSGLPMTLQDAVDILVEHHGSPHEAYDHLLDKFQRCEDVDKTLAAMSDMKQRFPEVRADE